MSKNKKKEHPKFAENNKKTYKIKGKNLKTKRKRR